MATLDVERSYLSVTKILRADDPKAEVTNELVTFLRSRLKPLKIRWNPRAFRAGLTNPALPAERLSKLEDFLGVAELLAWSLPKSVVEELDRIIEDVESFNPTFVNSLEVSRASGRVPASAIKKRAGG